MTPDEALDSIHWYTEHRDQWELPLSDDLKQQLQTPLPTEGGRVSVFGVAPSETAPMLILERGPGVMLELEPELYDFDGPDVFFRFGEATREALESLAEFDGW